MEGHAASLEDEPNKTQVFDRHSERCLDGHVTFLDEHPAACGGHADIWRGQYANRRVAVKVMRPWSSSGKRLDQDKLLRRLWREYLTWSSLAHVNVLELLGFSYEFSPANHLFPSLISPWMSNGTVDSYIENSCTADCLSLLAGIAEGLLYLHTRDPPIVHGDLRAGNVLISDSGAPCLSDFGLSRILNDVAITQTSSDPAGSLRWMAPELFREDDAKSIYSDVWAFGMTVLEVLSRDLPYCTSKSEAYVLGQITDGITPSRPGETPAGGTLLDELWPMCRRCWCFQPTQRPLMHQIIGTFRKYVRLPDADPSLDAAARRSVTSTRSPSPSAGLKSILKHESSPRTTVPTNMLRRQPISSVTVPIPDYTEKPDRVPKGSLGELVEFIGIPQFEHSVGALMKCYEALDNMKVRKDQCKQLHAQYVKLLFKFKESGVGMENVTEVERTIETFLARVQEWSSWSRTTAYQRFVEIGDELRQLNRDVIQCADILNVYPHISPLHANIEIVDCQFTPSFSDNLPAASQITEHIIEPPYSSTVDYDKQDIFLSEVYPLSDHAISSDELETVFPGEWCRAGKVSLKIFRGVNNTSVYRNRFISEVAELRRLNHINIENLIGIAKLDNLVYAVCPWAEHRDVLTYIQGHPHMNEFKILIEIITGLDFLHKNDVIHGNLRAARILISANGVAYISGFGLQGLIDEFTGESPPLPDIESIRWMAPELLDPDIKKYPIHRSKMSDVWSLGMLCLEVFSGQRPFYYQPDLAVVRTDILAGVCPKRPLLEVTNEELPNRWWELMQNCWNIDPKSRPSIDTLLRLLDDGQISPQSEIAPKILPRPASRPKGPRPFAVIHKRTARSLEFHARSDHHLQADARSSSVTDLSPPEIILVPSEPQSFFVRNNDRTLPLSRTSSMLYASSENYSLFSYSVEPGYSTQPTSECEMLLPNVFRVDDENCLDDRVIEVDAQPRVRFADIRKGYFGNQPVAIKSIRPYCRAEARSQESRFLQKLWLLYKKSILLSHRNIVPYLGFSHDFSPESSIFPSLIMPWMSNGTLPAYLEKFPNVDRYELILGVARGLSYLHNQDLPVVHGDVRAANILVSYCGVPCLNDPHTSDIAKLENVHTSTNVIGSLRWVSPELLRYDSRPDTSSDVWAYGMTVYEIISGSLPYEELTEPVAIFRRIRQGNIPLGASLAIKNYNLREICFQCWTLPAKQRPSMHTVLSNLECMRNLGSGSFRNSVMQ